MHAEATADVITTKYMKLSKIILEEKTKVVKLEDLTWNLVTSVLGEKPTFGFNFPNPDDSSTSIFGTDSLERWKSGIYEKYGNVNIKIDPTANASFDKIQVLDDKFKGDKDSYSNGKQAWLDAERASGRTSGLD